MGAERLLQYWESREAAIAREKEDPYNFGVELPHWKLADEQLKDHGELLLLGGNRSSKTEFCARRVVETAVKNPGANIWCLTANSQNSIAHQQAAVYRYLPNEFKKLGRGRVSYVSFSYKNGFTNSSFILPNRSTVTFRVWAQDISSLEGGEVGLLDDPVDGSHAIGIWADEEIPMPWIVRPSPVFSGGGRAKKITTLRYRCLTRADSKGIPARILLSFTTVSGWTNVVSSYLSGARTLISKPAELLDNEEVPIVQQSVRKNARIVYFHTQDNPFNSWKATKAQLAGAPRDEIKCRAYGLPTKPSTTVFRNLDDKVIYRHEEIPIIKDPENNACVYVLSIDPAGAKPWFMILVGITANGCHYVIDEFPSPEYGSWADLEKGEDKPGEAAAPNGYGIRDYAEVIKNMTKGLDNLEIVIDPRLGAASYQAAEGTSNIISDLADEEIYAIPAEGLDIETGLQSIQSLLAYDTSKPIGFDNHPKLIFSDKCGNTLQSCMNYKVELGPKSIFKDPVDCLRYIAIGNHRYYDDTEFEVTGTGGY